MSEQKTFIYCKPLKTVIAPNSIKEDEKWAGIESFLASLGCKIIFCDDETLKYYTGVNQEGDQA